MNRVTFPKCCSDLTVTPLAIEGSQASGMATEPSSLGVDPIPTGSTAGTTKRIILHPLAATERDGGVVKDTRTQGRALGRPGHTPKFAMDRPHPQEHEDTALAQLHAALHDDQSKLSEFEKSMARHQLALRHRQDYTAYCLRHGLTGEPNLAGEGAELIASLFATALRLVIRLPNIIIASFVAFLLSEIILFVVHDAIYLSFHYVIEPVRYDVSKAIDTVFDAVGNVIEGIVNAVEKIGAGAVNAVTNFFSFGHGTNIKPKTLKLPSPILPLQQSKLGALYPAIVNMKHLCSRATHARLHVVHLALQVFTGASLCQLLRQVYPSPLLRWMGDLLYGDDFVNPAGANCRVHVITAVCLSWNLNVLIWVFYEIYLVAMLYQSCKPTLSLIWRIWRAHVLAAYYTIMERRLDRWQAHRQEQLDKHARFQSHVDHLDKALSSDAHPT